MPRRLIFVISVLFIVSMVVSACATATEAPVAPEAAVVVEAPAESEAYPVMEAPAVTEAYPATKASVAVEPYPVTEEPAAEAPEATAAALKITGKVETEMAWSEEEVKAMNTIDVEATNSKGEKNTYTGVLLIELINLAKPTSDATTIVFVADDGYTAEVALADVMGCTDCILAFREQGGFSSVLPAFEKGLQVKGVIEIQVK